jgi:NAD(P) transhydrogenase subunit alpha
MYLAVPRESIPGERRVAVVPDVLGRLSAIAVEVLLESGAGDGAFFADASYEEKGATVVSDLSTMLARAEVIAKVRAPSPQEAAGFPEGTCLVSLLQPAADLEAVKVLTARHVTVFSLDLLPRISRAQSMDALSSQSTVSGYRAMLIAAERLPRFFPMFMTAAGTVPPAKVLVLGAGVAGLQAIATARRLGAMVRAYDVRAAAAEEVRSLGATFVELELESAEGSGGYAAEQTDDFLRRQRELIAKEVAVADAVVTTAAVPGRRAPVLITGEMVRQMRPGSVVVDLAAETGGNCELSEPGRDLAFDGVLVHGVSNLPSSMAMHASFLYARNIAEFLGLIAKDGKLAFDFDDEIIAGTCVTHAGEIRHAPTRQLIEGAPK